MEPLGAVGLDHIELFVGDLDLALAEYGRPYAFAATTLEDRSGRAWRAVLRQGAVRLVLTRPDGDDAGAAFVASHGDGVGDIALRVVDAADAFGEAVARGARPVREPAPDPRFPDEDVTRASVAGFGDVVHSLVQRPAAPEPASRAEQRFAVVDHLAVCLEPGTLDPTVEFYEQVLGFRHTFSERIEVGDQAMNSKVVAGAGGAVTLTLIEPDPAATPGQIDTFLKAHGGPGVQHVAFGTDDAVRAVRELRGRGVAFLSTPGAYYDALPRRLAPRGHPVEDLRETNLLVDEDHGGQLFQIFTRSTHERATLFFEVVERMGARSFGSANISALYEAVQRDLESGAP